MDEMATTIRQEATTYIPVEVIRFILSYRLRRLAEINQAHSATIDKRELPPNSEHIGSD